MFRFVAVVLIAFISTDFLDILDYYNNGIYLLNRPILAISLLLLVASHKGTAGHDRLRAVLAPMLPCVLFLGVALIGDMSGEFHDYSFMLDTIKIFILFTFITLFFRRIDYAWFSVSFQLIFLLGTALYIFLVFTVGLPHVRVNTTEIGINVNSNTISYLAVFSVLLIEHTRISSRKYFGMLYAILIIFTAFLVININQSIGAMSLLGFIMVVRLWLSRTPLAVKVLLFLLLFLFMFYGFYGAIEFLQPIIGRGKDLGTLDVRLFMAEVAWNEFVKAPLFGVGPKDIVTHYGQNHLYYLNIVAFYGILGLSIFLYWFYKMAGGLGGLRSSINSKMLLVSLLLMLFLAPPLMFFGVVFALVGNDCRLHLTTRDPIRI